MFLLSVLKNVSKRFARDIFRYGSVWLLIVIILILHFSGIFKLQFIDGLLKGETAVGQLGQTISNTITYTDGMSSSSGDNLGQAILELEQNNISTVEETDQQSISSKNITKDVFFIYKDGEYHPYNE